MITDKDIEQYLAHNKERWNAMTLRTRRSHLNSMRACINGEPGFLWNHLEKHYSSYTRTILWTSIGAFWDWYAPRQQNPYKNWKKSHAQRFKHSYERSPATMSYRDAKDKIERCLEGAARDRALYILNTGARWIESGVQEGFRVRGKGGKIRRLLPLEEGLKNANIAYRTFVRHLGKIGLTPHDLRKIYATELARRGATIYEICQLLGWEDINTALCYIGCTEDRFEELRRAG